MDIIPNQPDNWLKNVVEDRSSEVYKHSLLKVFHRMRVVEDLFLTEYKREGQTLSRDGLVKTAKEELNLKNSMRQQNLKDFPVQQVNTKMLEWYEPYDLSDEAIEDGVDWYSHLKNYFSGDEFLLTKYFEKFNRKLFMGTSDNSYSHEPSKKYNQFSDSIVSLVTDNVYEVLNVGKTDNIKGDEIPGALNIIAQKGAESEPKFIAGIKSLSDKFDRLYQEQLGK
jgi:hypothetical protein